MLLVSTPRSHLMDNSNTYQFLLPPIAQAPPTNVNNNNSSSSSQASSSSLSLPSVRSLTEQFPEELPPQQYNQAPSYQTQKYQQYNAYPPKEHTTPSHFQQLPSFDDFQEYTLAPHHAPTTSFNQTNVQVSTYPPSVNHPAYPVPHPHSHPPSPAQAQQISPQQPPAQRIQHHQIHYTRSLSPQTIGKKSHKMQMIVGEDLLKMRQSEAAVKLGIKPSTFSKRWRESLPERKWPYRKHIRLEKSIKMLSMLKHKPDDIIRDIQELTEERDKNIAPALVNLFDGNINEDRNEDIHISLQDVYSTKAH